jgi:hypothetical protein
MINRFQLLILIERVPAPYQGYAPCRIQRTVNYGIRPRGRSWYRRTRDEEEDIKNSRDPMRSTICD